MADRCVYLHKLKNGRVFYVGMGSVQRAYARSSRNQHWQNVVNKHGNFEVQLIASNLSIEIAAKLEIEVILIFGLENLTNVSSGGEASAFGMKHTEETKRKMSENSWHRTAHAKELYREKFSGSGNPMFGMSHGSAAKEKMRCKAIGRVVSKKTKVKMSISKLGKNNNAYDPKVYCFKNGNHEINATCYQFQILSGASQSLISMLKTGKRKTAKGWRIDNA